MLMTSNKALTNRSKSKIETMIWSRLCWEARVMLLTAVKITVKIHASTERAFSKCIMEQNAHAGTKTRLNIFLKWCFQFEHYFNKSERFFSVCVENGRFFRGLFSKSTFFGVCPVKQRFFQRVFNRRQNPYALNLYFSIATTISKEKAKKMRFPSCIVRFLLLSYLNTAHGGCGRVRSFDKKCTRIFLRIYRSIMICDTRKHQHTTNKTVHRS